MCGIIGYYNSKESIKKISGELWQRLIKSQQHRGPDSHGFWLDDKNHLLLGHNRLAIIDCTPAGHQPMISPSGRYVITYNGEIYNYKEIQKELLSFGYRFKGGSDTEVFLAAIEQWGLTEALKHCIGMFAFGLWDKREHKLFLVRDRLGIKPLYYGMVNESLCFASELKPLQIIFGNALSLNYDAMNLFFKKLYIPAPFSIYNEIKKVLPGKIVVFDLSGEKKLSPEIVSYWDMNNLVLNAKTNFFRGSREEAVEHLETLLKDAVAKRMRADVPYGAFLSGGIDSSLVVSLMQAQSSTPVNTFSIGFEDSKFDESQYATEIAKHLGTNHRTLHVNDKQLLDVVPQLPTIYDEPFADASQIPTFIVSKMAKQYVTVALSGDGGDEVFGGYDRYTLCDSYWNKFKHLPLSLRKSIECSLKIMQRDTKGGRLARATKIASSNNALDFYQNKLTVWSYPEIFTGKKTGSKIGLSKFSEIMLSLSPIEQFMLFDSQTYLPNDILTKVDRASMANSLEVRVPVLDHRVVEFAWGMPLDYKLASGIAKWPLRKILSKYVPTHLYERQKQGFSTPLAEWLRKDLKDWAEDLIFAKYLKNDFQLNYKSVQKMWKQHQAGTHNRSYYLWPAICLSAWLEKYHTSGR